MKKIMILVIAFLFLMNFVSAEVLNTEPSYIFEKYNSADVAVECYDNFGSQLSGSSIANITITYPESSPFGSSAMVSNQEMNYNSSDGLWHYKTQFNYIGDYKARGFCSNTADQGAFSFTIQVSNDGELIPARTMWSTNIILFVVSIVLFLIGIILELLEFVTLSGIIMVANGIYILKEGIPGFNNEFVTLILGIVALGVGFIILARNSIVYLEELNKLR